MVALKLILFTLLLTIVDCREFGRHISRGNVRHRQAAEEYNYNHPPASENYEPIPVAVVYEDEGSRKDKSVISDIPETNKIQQINRGTPKSNINITIEDSNKNIDILVDPNKAGIIEEYELKPTGRPTAETKTSNQEHQIPVAVVYEPESSYYTGPTGHRRRKIPRPASEEKRVAPEAEQERVAFTAEEKRVSPAAEQEQVAPAAEKRRVAPAAEEKRVAPAADEKQVSPAAEQKQVAPAAEKRRVASVAEKKRVAPTADENRDSPAAEQEQVAPASEKRRVAPAAKEKQAASTAEQKRVGPAVGEKRVAPPVEKKRVGPKADEKQSGPMAEKKRIDPAAEEKQLTVNEAIYTENQKAYEITTTRYHETIRSNSESNQPQQFPKRDNIDNSTLRKKEVVPIVQSENLVFSHSGDFQYSYEGGDGTKAFEKGQLKTYEDDNAGEAVSGGFSYTAKDGNEYSLTYTADENGYRPVGAHLPTPPPIPPAIARALAYLATKTTPEPVTDSLKESDTYY